MKYYRVLDELNEPKDRWFLKSINVVDKNVISAWEFSQPNQIELPTTEKIVISLRENGVPLDFTFADFDILIVNERVALLLSEDECQLIPIEVQGVVDSHLYFICVLLTCVDCLDESRSVYEKFTIDDPIRPDKAGQYKSIYKLFIDQQKVDKHRIFRLKNADSIIIANEELRRKFLNNGITGLQFKEIN